MPKRLNPNLAKIHRNYTVEEVAGLYGVHTNTVRSWIKVGLPVCDARRPTLILGADLRDFLKARRQARKRRCKDDELFCLRCRAPKRPAEGMVDFIPLTATTGRISGLCPECTGVMNRYSSVRGLDRIRQKLDVHVPKLLQHISESS